MKFIIPAVLIRGPGSGFRVQSDLCLFLRARGQGFGGGRLPAHPLVQRAARPVHQVVQSRVCQFRTRLTHEEVGICVFEFCQILNVWQRPNVCPKIASLPLLGQFGRIFCAVCPNFKKRFGNFVAFILGKNVVLPLLKNFDGLIRKGWPQA